MYPDTMTYTKRFHSLNCANIAREVELQRLASGYGLSPNVIDTDNMTYIAMEDLKAMNIADVYGDKIEDMPELIRREIWNILWFLYSCCNIEYVDVTPYNFVEKDGKIWIVDFGHAKKIKRGHIDPWLHGVLSDDRQMIYEWNAEFA
jgi:RIO-like serine/threonine protein kinase